MATYVCSACGNSTFRWMGKCPACGEFSTLEEQAAPTATAEAKRAGLKSSTAITPSKKASTLGAIQSNPIVRTATGINELDRVLGGGFVDAEVVLFAGHPGAGKSTLCLDIANRFASKGHTVLYSSGEESVQQIGLRAKRMNIDNENIKIINETSIEVLQGHIEAEKPKLLIVDSLQTIASSEIPGSIGSVSQSKEAANVLTRIAKTENITMVIINQIIKSGEFAGSESVQHIVDCALILESDSDTPLKFLRATKNRFGDTSEVGVFQHTEGGLEEVSDPSGIFMEDSGENDNGTSCSFLSEGVRQIPVEVQALVSRSDLPTPRKQFNGVDYQRGQIVCAILDKFCKTRTYEKDVFVSTVSGIKARDPQIDLSIAASILSSSKEQSYGSKTVFIGELSLTGHVRGSFMIENKLREAERLGFTTAVVPENAKSKLLRFKTAMKIIYIKSVKDLPSLLK